MKFSITVRKNNAVYETLACSKCVSYLKKKVRKTIKMCEKVGMFKISVIFEEKIAKKSKNVRKNNSKKKVRKTHQVRKKVRKTYTGTLHPYLPQRAG